MTGAPVRISATDARRMAIAAQRLVAPPNSTPGGVLEVTRDIGYLQLDPTNVVARNPLLVLWSRLGVYDRVIVEDLLARRELFETPSLILPTSDLAIHGATMRAYRRATEPGAAAPTRGRLEGAGGGTWPKRAAAWLRKNPHMRAMVLSRLRREGPLPLAAFEDRAVVSWTSGGWNDERNVTMLLAILQRRGEVVVAGRRNGQKLFGIARGWYPRTRPLVGDALSRESTRRAIRALGVGTLKQLRSQYAFGRHVTQRAVDALERAGEIVRVEIDGVPSRAAYYGLAELPTLREVREQWEERTTLLSPFDNLIIDRDRTEALFGYRYRMEIYVPPHLRKLGYWAMPVLHGDRIVGSVDPRVDRARGELVVNRVVLAPGAPRSAMPAIRRATGELAVFVGAKRVVWQSPAR